MRSSALAATALLVAVAMCSLVRSYARLLRNVEGAVSGARLVEE